MSLSGLEKLAAKRLANALPCRVALSGAPSGVDDDQPLRRDARGDLGSLRRGGPLRLFGAVQAPGSQPLGNSSAAAQRPVAWHDGVCIPATHASPAPQ